MLKAQSWRLKEKKRA